MFEYNGTRALLIEAMRNDTDQNFQLNKVCADMEYLAMMSDIDLDEDEEEEENVEEV